MIVEKVKDGWKIIQHPAHALLAMEICMELKLGDISRSEKAAILNALALHDDQESSFESREYIDDNGAPLDFTLIPLNDPMRSGHVSRIIHAGYLKSSHVGALVHRHFVHLYADGEISKEMKSILNEYDSRYKKLLNSQTIDEGFIKKCYPIMRFCDRLSLPLCQDKVPEMNRNLEINTFRTYGRINIRRDEDFLLCEPWPFKTNVLKLKVEYFKIEQLSFEDNFEFEVYLNSQLPNVLEFTFKEESQNE